MLTQKLFSTVCLIAFPIATAVPAGWAAADEPSTAQPTAKASADKASNETKPREKDAKAPASNASVDQLIEQLDSADFAKREAACGDLTAKGKEAIPALEKAAVKGDLEVSSRALNVLEKLLKSTDDKTSKAAEESLQRLADGDSPAAARKAKSMLDKKNGVTTNKNNNNNPFQQNGMLMPGGFGGGRIIINGGMLQIGGGAGVKSLSVSNNNGVRQIKATDGDKTVKIDDDPANGIKIECTDKVNGKEVTKKYQAKNVDELKKKEPEGYKLYKEYGEQNGNGNGAIQLQIGGAAPLMPLQPNILPAMPLMPAIPAQPAIPATPGAAPNNGAAPDNNVQLDIAASKLKRITAQLEGLRNNEAIKSASDERKAELKKQIEELSRSADELKKQLDKK
jgi:hypothetical protein